MARKQLSYPVFPQQAVNIGDTSPNPGPVGTQVFSSVLQDMVVWDGTKWKRELATAEPPPVLESFYGIAEFDHFTGHYETAAGAGEFGNTTAFGMAILHRHAVGSSGFVFGRAGNLNTAGWRLSYINAGTSTPASYSFSVSTTTSSSGGLLYRLPRMFAGKITLLIVQIAGSVISISVTPEYLHTTTLSGNYVPATSGTQRIGNLYVSGGSAESTNKTTLINSWVTYNGVMSLAHITTLTKESRRLNSLPPPAFFTANCGVTPRHAWYPLTTGYSAVTEVAPATISDGAGTATMTQVGTVKLKKVSSTTSVPPLWLGVVKLDNENYYSTPTAVAPVGSFTQDFCIVWVGRIDEMAPYNGTGKCVLARQSTGNFDGWELCASSWGANAYIKLTFRIGNGAAYTEVLRTLYQDFFKTPVALVVLFNATDKNLAFSIYTATSDSTGSQTIAGYTPATAPLQLGAGSSVPTVRVPGMTTFGLSTITGGMTSTAMRTLAPRLLAERSLLPLLAYGAEYLYDINLDCQEAGNTAPAQIVDRAGGAALVRTGQTSLAQHVEPFWNYEETPILYGLNKFTTTSYYTANAQFALGASTGFMVGILLRNMEGVAVDQHLFSLYNGTFNLVLGQSYMQGICKNAAGQAVRTPWLSPVNSYVGAINPVLCVFDGALLRLYSAGAELGEGNPMNGFYTADIGTPTYVGRGVTNESVSTSTNSILGLIAGNSVPTLAEYYAWYDACVATDRIASIPGKTDYRFEMTTSTGVAPDTWTNLESGPGSFNRVGTPGVTPHYARMWAGV